jgi:RNase P subunit RPR2
MLKCNKCNSRVFIDRQYTTYDHVETFCVSCGDRKFYHPAQNSKEGRWLLQKELLMAKATITSL